MEHRRPGDWVHWCIPAGALSGVRIGIHWTFPLFLLLYAVRAGSESGARWGLAVGLAILLLYVFVVAHEFGHVFAARREGIDSDRVMLWPLGGLAYLGQEARGSAEVRIAAAGPAVNLLAGVLLLPLVAMVGIRIGLPLLNPFDWARVESIGGPPSFLQDVVQILFKLNLVMCLFNLIPAYPMDGGRILRGLLYPKYGLVRSVYVATSISFFFAAGIILWGLLAGMFILFLIGVFTIVGAWSTRRQVAAQAAAFEAERGGMGHGFSPEAGDWAGTSFRNRRRERREKRERRRRKRREEEERLVDERVDQVLEKISRGGMESLSRRERAFLLRASRRKR